MNQAGGPLSEPGARHCTGATSVKLGLRGAEVSGRSKQVGKITWTILEERNLKDSKIKAKNSRRGFEAS